MPRVQEQAIFLQCMMGAGPLVSRDRGMVPRLAPSRPAGTLPHIYIFRVTRETNAAAEKGDILVRALSALPSAHPEVTDTRGPFLRARA